MKTSLDPPGRRRSRIKSKGKTTKKAKDKIRKANEEHPFARECIDWLLRYRGDSAYLRALRDHAKANPDWLPERDTIIEVNLRATQAQRDLRKRLKKMDGMDLPDSLADPGEI